MNVSSCFIFQGVAVCVALVELLIVFISCAMGKRMGHNSQYV